MTDILKQQFQKLIISVIGQPIGKMPPSTPVGPGGTPEVPSGPGVTPVSPGTGIAPGTPSSTGGITETPGKPGTPAGPQGT